MLKMEDTTPSMPISSRLDHLDFLMKYLERKQEFQKRGSIISNTCYGGERHHLPPDLALKEVHFKGCLLDRVSSLEHRLSQLCLETESSSSSGTSTQTSGDNSSSSQGSKGESSISIETRPISQPLSLAPVEIQGKSTTTRGKQKKELQKQQLRKNTKSNKNENSLKNGNNKRSWPHFKLLGC